MSNASCNKQSFIWLHADNLLLGTVAVAAVAGDNLASGHVPGSHPLLPCRLGSHPLVDSHLSTMGNNGQQQRLQAL
jgi:hypothetical protein